MSQLLKLVVSFSALRAITLLHFKSKLTDVPVNFYQLYVNSFMVKYVSKYMNIVSRNKFLLPTPLIQSYLTVWVSNFTSFVCVRPSKFIFFYYLSMKNGSYCTLFCGRLFSLCRALAIYVIHYIILSRATKVLPS